MSFLDRFRSQKGKDLKRTPATGGADDAKKKQFANVPAAGRNSDAPTGEQKAEKRTTEKKEKREPHITGPAYRILQYPLVTEKTSMLAEHGQYAFAVDVSTNKVEVAEAVERVYGIRPVRVRMQLLRGKQVRYGRSTGFTKTWKKAVITLPQGKTIDVFEV